jgi:glycosyltransferase involved in cell wall biosynthesis
VDAVLVVSEAAKDFLDEQHRLPPGFVRVLLNGVPLGDYATPDDPRATPWRDALRHEWGIPPDAFLIGMVGRLRRKGQEELIAAAPCLAERFPNVRFVLVGPEFKPGDREYYAERVRSARVADRFVLAGSREDIPTVMAALDLLVHLPADEAFGLVLVEAMAAGVPVIASKVGGCIEVVQDGTNGLLVPVGDEGLLCAALLALLDPEAGEQRRAALRAAGLKRAQEFSLERQVERLHAIYSELSGKT